MQKQEIIPFIKKQNKINLKLMLGSGFSPMHFSLFFLLNNEKYNDV